MAGHCKWANIQHRKGRQDAKRGKVFTKLIKEITVAARMGGGDADMNPRLRLAIDKAKAESTCRRTTSNARSSAAAASSKASSYEEIRYEGYGIGGAAVMVDCLTDNKTRTVADVRHAFTKHGGNLGTDGSVAFLFKHCGQFLFAPGTNEDKVMEAALEAGAEDVIANDDGSDRGHLRAAGTSHAVKAGLEKAGFKPESPRSPCKRDDRDRARRATTRAQMQKLLDALDVLDDVQECLHADRRRPKCRHASVRRTSAIAHPRH